MVSLLAQSSAAENFFVNRTVPEPCGSPNLLLKLVTREALRRLPAEIRFLRTGAVLQSPCEPPRFIHFPHRGSIVSNVPSTMDGAMVETGVVGEEGLTAVTAILGPVEWIGMGTIVQADGGFTSIRTEFVQRLFDDEGRFRKGVLRFASAAVAQLTQNALCNRLHHSEERLARWLLTYGDRNGAAELRVTQEFLAQMLGIHRPRVSNAAASLEMDQLISIARRRITIVDRDRLERRACECYRFSRKLLEQLRSALSSIDTPANEIGRRPQPA